MKPKKEVQMGQKRKNFNLTNSIYMKKVVFTIAVAMLFGFSVIAQEKKVAVFDPAGEVAKYLKEIVREEISSIVVNTAGYTVLERSLIDKVLEENKFQLGGLVDDSQIGEIGKRMGANYVFVSSITSMENGNLFISCKMIDVQTARIEMQKTSRTQKGSNDLADVIQKLVGEMLGKTSEKPKEIVERPKETNKPVISQNALLADGRKVFKNGVELNKNEVKSIMANTDALRMYNKGLSNNKTGNVLLSFGIPISATGLVFTLLAPKDNIKEYDNYYYKNLIIRKDSTGNGGDGGNDDYYGGNSGNGGNSRGLYLGVGVSCLVVGATMVTTGIVLKAKSKKDIRNSVNTYNNGSKLSNTELKFGFSPNSFKLALTF